MYDTKFVKFDDQSNTKSIIMRRNHILKLSFSIYDFLFIYE